jgi:catechol 2,3-dioxygenase-like lactoylglutathione lyase family enzyme
MNITHVQLLSVPVTDQGRARDFYVDTLGMDLVSDDTTDPNQTWTQVAPKGGGAGLTLVTWFETMPPGSLRGLVLHTADVDDDTERLRQAGVKVDGPQDAPWGRHSMFEDPDGNGLILTGQPVASPGA